jgi:predicted methyltransferase
MIHSTLNKAAVCLLALTATAVAPTMVSAGDDEMKLDKALAAQDEATQARYAYRHPKETLEFFGVKPGMTVIEGLPGGGWYSKILIDYLGEDGQLIGANYAWSIFPRFGFFNDEQLEDLKTWEADWPVEAEAWRGEHGAQVTAFSLGSMPDSLDGTVDVVLMIRALHNLNRFESEGGYLTSSLQDLHDALKPGGVLGVVQHQAPDDNPDEWADGSAGYLKKDYLIERIEQAGFEFVAESDINENPADQPGTEDVVWRLPPTLATSREDAELRAEMEAIGESNRMTLKFRKP